MSDTTSTINDALPFPPPPNYLKELFRVLTLETTRATFACGGELLIQLQPNRDDAGNLSPRIKASIDEQLAVIKPVTIRFGPSGTGQTLIIPALNDEALEGLLSVCAPATFGRAGKDVYDEDYRKAIKLDTTEFTTDFSPYETGIIDIIAQLLLPSISTDKFGIRAELYKLNAYRAPSGHFRPHVDTPRGEDQIGSLVVCLPTAFEGGELAVRHKGTDTRFNWSSTSTSSPKIQWAAFYSDCEHEVFPVTSGSRITLTYNLFASRGPGKLAGSQTINANPTSLPLYTTVQDALASPKFMRKGGELGIYLAHAYPFTHSTLHRTVRPALKGVDMALYASLKAAGLSFRLVRDVKGGGHGFYDDFYDSEKDYYDDEYDDFSEDEKDDEDSSDSASETVPENDSAQLGVTQPSSANPNPTAPNPTTPTPAPQSQYPWLNPRAPGVYLKGFQPTKAPGGMWGDEADPVMDKYRGIPYRAKQILWLNKRTHTELNYAYLAYGNCADLGTVYTTAAFLVSVKAAKKRRQVVL